MVLKILRLNKEKKAAVKKEDVRKMLRQRKKNLQRLRFGKPSDEGHRIADVELACQRLEGFACRAITDEPQFQAWPGSTKPGEGGEQARLALFGR